MEIMPSRLEKLDQALAGLNACGVPLVAYSNGKFIPAGLADDVGTYYVIPQVARLLGLSIPQAVQTFYYLAIAVSALLGMAGALVLWKDWVQRVYAVVALLGFSAYIAKTGDVYVLGPCLVMSLVPWTMVIIGANLRLSLKCGVVGLSGLLIGLAHYMRAHSGTGVLLFGLTSLVMNKSLIQRTRLSLIASLLLGCLLGWGVWGVVVKRSNDFVRAQNPSYIDAPRSHPFWHAIYVGLGFVTNPYVSGFHDEVGEAKAREVDPSVVYESRGYEALLKREVFKIHSIRFWINNFGAKSGVLLLYFCLFANLGLLLSLLRQESADFSACFYCAICFYSLPGLLVVPLPNYLLSLFACAVLYNVYMANTIYSRRSQALQRDLSRREAESVRTLA